jgi:hypothetical protein
MSTIVAQRPDTSEYSEYYQRYVNLVAEGDVMETLAVQMADSLTMLADLDDAQTLFRYAPEKWSIKETVGHLMDTERVFAYRALRIARGDKTPLPGFDQEALIKAAHFDERPWGELLREWRIVREANLALFHSLDDDAMMRVGTANGENISVRSLPWIMAGHELHHMNIIRERYLTHWEAK